MTDRSSEERSRFEEERANFEAWYRDHPGTVSIWHAWQARAALEDRQEAAPICPVCKEVAIQCGAISGVPSEATPSKENAPLPVPTYFVTHPYGSYSIADPDPAPAPAPEVQGTPFKDAVLAMGGDESDAKAAILRAHAEGKVEIDMDWNVGTPQKETPPVFIKRYTTEEARAAGLPVADGAVEILLYGSSVGAAPEGVQGKEPQTFDEFWAIKQPFDGDSPVGAKFWARKSWAAGRRSAITELQETVADWGRRSRDAFFVEACVWCLKKCAELQEKTK